MSTTLKQIEKHEKTLARVRKRFMADKKITKKEQARLDEIQKKIDRLFIALAGEAEIIVVNGNPPPKHPVDENGDVSYAGLPVDKLKTDYQKNVAKTSARRIRRGVRSLAATAESVDESSREHEGQTTKFDATVAYSDDANSAFSRDIKKGKFDKLSREQADDLMEGMNSYENASSEVKSTTSLLEAQAWKLGAAKALVTQANALLETYHQKKKQDAANKELEEVKAKLENLGNAADFIIDAHLDPKAVAKKLGTDIAKGLAKKFLVELMGGAVYEREIKEIEAEIARIAKKIDDLELSSLKAGLDSALNTVKAEQEVTRALQEKLSNAKAEQGRAIDRLATLEKKSPGTTGVFGELQEYYGNVQEAAAETLKSSRELTGVLQDAQKSMAYTDTIKQTVRRDSSNMRILFQDDSMNMAVLEHEHQARELLKYADQMKDWYDSQNAEQQLAEQQDQQASLLQNKQFDYIGQMINAIQEQGFGHRQKDKLTTR